MQALTHVPLPKWKNIVAALMSPTRPDIELSTPWRRSGDMAFWFSRSAWSLLALAQWRQRLTGQPSITVFLPDFFCNASLVPLRSMGVQLEFYPLTDQMAPDRDACRTLADEKCPDLFVIVHFFGQPALVEGATALCCETGAWLIEDAAHVLRPIAGIGVNGDCVLYSPYKHLPIPDGAVAVVRENGPAKLATKRIAMGIFQEVHRSFLDTPGFSNRPSRLWLGKRILQRLGVRAWRQPITPFLMDMDTAYNSPGLEHPKMSLLARRLLSGLLETLDTVAHLRQQNRLLWNQLLLKDIPTLSDIKPLLGEYTPYLVGFAFHDEEQAEKAFFQWQSAGLPVITWPDLPPEVLAQKERHRDALLLRKTRIYLPVHQSIEHDQITNCVGSL